MPNSISYKEVINMHTKESKSKENMAHEMHESRIEEFSEAVMKKGKKEKDKLGVIKGWL